MEFDEYAPARIDLAGRLSEIALTLKQEEDATRIEDILTAKARAEVRYAARLIASKSNRELPGEARRTLATT